jgi:hypothetical protein
MPEGIGTLEGHARVLALALAVMGAVSGVDAAGLDGKYLTGKWEINNGWSLWWEGRRVHRIPQQRDL